MVARHAGQLKWAPNFDDDPARGVVNTWIEPWVGDLWEWLDLRVILARAGLPVADVDPDALPAPAQELLGEWVSDLGRRREEEEARRKAAS